MKNRFSKMSKASVMLALLTACGLTSSCKDEYLLDDEKPEWLNSSILESLQKNGNYTNYLRLLSDADVNPLNARPLTEVLNRTGSKTVFVANDEAWQRFFQENAQRPESDPWHTATSYENLSVSQKKLLIHTSMLNNAIVMENLASSTSTNNQAPTRGEYLRRFTDFEVTDSITHLDGNSLPVSYSEGNGDTDYWKRFRSENGGNGIYMVNDSSLSMMVHFTNEYLKKQGITDEDFRYITGSPRRTEDVHIYDSKIVDKDAVCENGYVNTTEKIIAPLPNMAEMLRTNGQTYIFSHMLDRWSAPFYNRGVTEAYKNLMASRGIEWTDSIFTKRYFSDLSWGHRDLLKDPNFKEVKDAFSKDISLKFDPGWNGYYDEYSGPEYDMAAMYVPNDETLWQYFTKGGGGWQLIQTYYLKAGTPDEIAYEEPKDFEDLYKQIDQIPISTLRSLINQIMFKSFSSSVPSKMTKLRSAEGEQIFFADDIDHIKGSKLTNNGVIYITDRVYGPADYTSVMAPAYISNDNLVMRWAITNGSTKAPDFMGLNYYAYLKAMQSRFVFFLPSDAAMKYFYDPVSFKSQRSRIVTFSYNKTKENDDKFPPINYTMYDYNNSTGEVGKAYSMETMTKEEVVNRLKDVLESHTIVLNGKEEIDSDIDEYYVTKNNSAIKVTREGGKIVRIQGGFQLENEIDGKTAVITADNKDAYTEIKGMQTCDVDDEHKMNNGTTYILDAPAIPSSRSVYSVLTNDGRMDSDDFGAFYNLCEGVNDDLLKKCGLISSKKTGTALQTELKKFNIFTEQKSPDMNVTFFNNYQYTVFVPTKDAIEDAIAKGLPTWEDIETEYNSLANEDGELTTTEDSLHIQAMITYLTNFLRNHFVDNSVFVDKSTFDSQEYVTASFNNEKGLFCKVNMRRPQAGMLQICDNNDGEGQDNWLTIGGKYNIMTRDIECNKTPSNAKTMNSITIDGSSFAVVHQIPGVLKHTTLVNGRHDSAWSTPSAAKKYMKKFAIH